MLIRLLEDARILAVLKPSGTPSVSQTGSNLRSMEDEVFNEFPLNTPLLLHRLDTGTSGVLLFAKSTEVFNEMRLKFTDRSIEKHYWAFVHPKEAFHSSGRASIPEVIRIPLGHHPKSKKRMIPLPPGQKRSYRGKPLPAETLIHGKQSVRFEGHPCERLNVEITTGVMHQIRVHLAFRGTPILGDPLYGKKEPVRLGLHARRVSFELRGFRYQIEAPLEGQE
jgi:23S rRNA pseudouridine1911/1915/1917 synthase